MQKPVFHDARRGVEQARCDEQERETLQLTDKMIVDAQQRSRLVQRTKEKGEHRGLKTEVRHKLVLVNTTRGR
ncbi:hypothetical protein PI125_g7966 [Phytophthora idaei]|nr:hypothetical protein PI125_g7966 [Phytophthora idaei]